MRREREFFRFVLTFQLILLSFNQAFFVQVCIRDEGEKMTAGSGMNPLGTALFFLMAAFLLLIAPSLKLLESCRFSKNAVTVEAEIIKYDPEVQGMAGGRQEIRDFYTIRYLGILSQFIPRQLAAGWLIILKDVLNFKAISKN